LSQAVIAVTITAFVIAAKQNLFVQLGSFDVNGVLQTFISHRCADTPVNQIKPYLRPM
jgi:hypothetical protein